MGFRLALAGRPKSGKTGAIAGLANAGYTIRYCDFDDNAAPIYEFCDDDAARARIQLVRCVDRLRIDAAGDIVVDGGQGLLGWGNFRGALETWPIDGSKVASWDAKDILVIDSFSELCKSLARRQQVLENRSKKKYTWDDYSRVQKQAENLLVFLKGHLPTASLIVVFHLKPEGPDLDAPLEIEDDALREEIVRQKLRGADNVEWHLAPISFGKALNDVIAGHFTGTIYAKPTARGRKLFTAPEDGFDAGVPVAGIAKELDLKDGLARVWAGVGLETKAPTAPPARKTK